MSDDTDLTPRQSLEQAIMQNSAAWQMVTDGELRGSPEERAETLVQAEKRHAQVAELLDRVPWQDEVDAERAYQTRLSRQIREVLAEQLTVIEPFDRDLASREFASNPTGRARLHQVANMLRDQYNGLREGAFLLLPYEDWQRLQEEFPRSSDPLIPYDVGTSFVEGLANGLKPGNDLLRRIRETSP